MVPRQIQLGFSILLRHTQVKKSGGALSLSKPSRCKRKIFAGYWPEHKEEPRWGKPFDIAKKYVVSHKPVNLSWSVSELITGDILAELKKLKNADGSDLLIYGSSNLIQTLLKNNLIDRMHIWTFPITIGTGKKLFAEGTKPQRFKVVDTKITTTGVVFATYEPSSSLKGGSI